MSALDELKSILIPPAKPFATGSPEQWDTVEGHLGLRLPGDYKGFVSAYGLGTVRDYTWVLNPFVDLDGYSLRQAVEHYRATCHYRDFMNPERLVPWGSNESGGSLFWVTGNPDPDRWTVFEDFEEFYGEYPATMTEYLRDVVSERYQSPIVGIEPVEHPAYYYPWFGSMTGTGLSVTDSSRDHVFGYNALCEIFQPRLQYETSPFHYQFRVPPNGWYLRYQVHPKVTVGLVYDHHVSIRLDVDDLKRANALCRQLELRLR